MKYSQSVNVDLWLIQSYWIFWLMLSFIVSIFFGGVVLRNWEMAK